MDCSEPMTDNGVTRNDLWKTWRPKKRRRDLDDPFFEEGDRFCSEGLYKKICVEEDDNEEEFIEDKLLTIPCQIGNCLKVFHSNIEYEMHYNSLHKNQCRDCHRNFPTSYLLDIHIAEWHDSMFELLMLKQKMFQCLVESCDLKFQTAKERKNHLIKTHQYPSNYRFDRQRKSEKSTRKKNHPAQPDIKTTDISEKGLDERLGGNADMDTTESTQGHGGHQSQGHGGHQSQGHASYTSPSHVSASGRTFVYNVPKTICFGAGSQRGFSRPRGGRGGGRGRGRGGRKKHWHQNHNLDMDTTVDIQEVKMGDLADALK